MTRGCLLFLSPLPFALSAHFESPLVMCLAFPFKASIAFCGRLFLFCLTLASQMIAPRPAYSRTA
jgi:hypothetical protein